MAYLTGAGFWAGRTGDGPGAGARAGAPTGGGGVGGGGGGGNVDNETFRRGRNTMGWGTYHVVKAENSENSGVTRKKLVQLGKFWSHSENFGVTRKILETLGKKWSFARKIFVRSPLSGFLQHV